MCTTRVLIMLSLWTRTTHFPKRHYLNHSTLVKYHVKYRVKCHEYYNQLTTSHHTPYVGHSSIYHYHQFAIRYAYIFWSVTCNFEKKSSTKASLSDVRYCIWSHHQDMVYIATYMPTNLLDGDFLQSGSLL